ncbi:MAG: hypothetical protein HRU37_13940 [Roseibacillus sp.]|nr:hypothetical protein [Roseibacillus sp.]
MLDTHRNLTNGRKMAEDPAKPNYSIRIAFKGRRVLFPLGTPNREKAASNAQAIYFSLQTNGWEESLRRFKPEPEKSQRVATIGDYIEELEGGAEGSRVHLDLCREGSFMRAIYLVVPNHPWKRSLSFVRLDSLEVVLRLRPIFPGKPTFI